MRKGFTIMEMLTVMVVTAMFSIAFAPLFLALVRDIPTFHRTVQANTSLLNMLGQVRKDIDAAGQLPEMFAGRVTGDELLLIEVVDGVICYQLEEGRVLRYKLTVAGESSGENTTVWRVPRAHVAWRVWKRDGKGYAVEVKTYIEYNVGRDRQEKMANSHVYFLGVF
ncbi:MAG: PulJ/GspJ family protein [Planctomycetota bacterium]|jgi:prepilin-type N-terminal cleavage/methylation domain-containing protein